MANLSTKLRTNFFHVKDEAEFCNFMSRVYGEDKIDLYEETDGDGNPVFAFGSEGRISGVKNALDDDCDSWAGCENCEHLQDGDCDGCPGNVPSAYDEFIDGLQGCVSNDDAIIMMEIGAEKLRFVAGSATIITSKDYRFVSLADVAQDAACKMLHNENWAPLNNY